MDVLFPILVVALLFSVCGLWYVYVVRPVQKRWSEFVSQTREQLDAAMKLPDNKVLKEISKNIYRTSLLIWADFLIEVVLICLVIYLIFGRLL